MVYGGVRAVMGEDVGRTAALDDVMSMLGLAADILVRDVMDARGLYYAY